jgi:hypothetical protein
MGLAAHNIFNWVPDKIYIRLVWWFNVDYPLNLENPGTYNEKIQWMKLNLRDSFYTTLVDKYAVRKYVSDKIGEQYLIPLLGVYDNVGEIEWDAFPDQFVLKCNHDSGSIVICKDKSTFDIKAAKKKLARQFRNNTTYNIYREWPYKNVERKIICEKFLEDETGDLADYKFLCFDGEPKSMYVITERSSGDYKTHFYDLQFNNLNPVHSEYDSKRKELTKPKGFEEMIRLARILSQDLVHVRVDFYDLGGKVFFGELTFFPGSGLYKFPPGSNINELWGSWTNLPSLKKAVSLSGT